MNVLILVIVVSRANRVSGCDEMFEEGDLSVTSILNSPGLMDAAVSI